LFLDLSLITFADLLAHCWIKGIKPKSVQERVCGDQSVRKQVDLIKWGEDIQEDRLPLISGLVLDIPHFE
jgi:hypothetical protein